MYKYLALGIIAIAGILAIPVTVDSQDEFKLYGYATLVLRDSVGQAVFQQLVHNSIGDGGENMMLAQIFNNGTASATFTATESDLIDALCVTTEASFVVVESRNAVKFNAADGTSGNNCETVAFSITNVDGVNQATTGVIQFNATASTGNIGTGETITGVGVCSDNGSTGENKIDAFNEGCNAVISGELDLLATFDTSDVTLSGAETVDITYTLALE